MKTYEVKLDALTLEAENEQQAIDLAIEYFKDISNIQKHEISEVQ